MKFCTHCGNEISDESIVCVKCGCAVAKSAGTKSIPTDEATTAPNSHASLILGIVGIVFAFLFALVGHITSIIGIILGIKEYRETESMAGLVLSIIGEVCSIFSSIIGAVTLSGIFS